MSFQYRDINLSVNGGYIMADTVNVSEESLQKPIYSFNNNIPFDNVPTNLKGSISIDYYLNPDDGGITPIYFSIINNINGLISDTTTPLPSLINIGEVYITGYINSFSLKLSPNGLIKANCSFDIFYPFTGNLLKQNSVDSYLYDSLNSSGISNYWSAHFYSGSNIVTDNDILQMNYSVQIGTSPIYSIGNPYPVQIYISNITESIDLLTERQYNTIYSGQTFDINRADLQNLVLSGISSTGILTIPMTGFILQDCKWDVTTDNLILFNNTYSRSR